MSKPVARYAVSFGLSGCYLPDSHSGPFLVTRRRDLAVAIKYELMMYEMPKSLIKEVNINRLWAFIKRHGSSCAHFSLNHKRHSLSFHGLTEDEFQSLEDEVCA